MPVPDPKTWVQLFIDSFDDTTLIILIVSAIVSLAVSEFELEGLSSRNDIVTSSFVAVVVGVRQAVRQTRHDVDAISHAGTAPLMYPLEGRRGNSNAKHWHRRALRLWAACVKKHSPLCV